MSNWYLKLTGKFAAALGRLDKYSTEHLTFLSSGYECPRCKETLMKWYGVANVHCLGTNDEHVPVALIRMKGKTFECPKCRYRWEFRTT
jgi:predicted RNA-binding Zn-ribbon protein involved in translation (DUF1610 family)